MEYDTELMIQSTKLTHNLLALTNAASHTRVREEVAREAFTRGADQVLESDETQPTEGYVSITAVICDDHPAFAQGVAALLQLEPDISVIGVATNGKEAIRMVRVRLPDIVLMDVVMPPSFIRLPGRSCSGSKRHRPQRQQARLLERGGGDAVGDRRSGRKQHL